MAVIDAGLRRRPRSICDPSTRPSPRRRTALWALILRDLVVLRKHLFEFVPAR